MSSRKIAFLKKIKIKQEVIYMKNSDNFLTKLSFRKYDFYFTAFPVL